MKWAVLIGVYLAAVVAVCIAMWRIITKDRHP